MIPNGHGVVDVWAEGCTWCRGCWGGQFAAGWRWEFESGGLAERAIEEKSGRKLWAFSRTELCGFGESPSHVWWLVSSRSSRTGLMRCQIQPRSLVCARSANSAYCSILSMVHPHEFLAELTEARSSVHADLCKIHSHVSTVNSTLLERLTSFGKDLPRNPLHNLPPVVSFLLAAMAPALGDRPAPEPKGRSANHANGKKGRHPRKCALPVVSPQTKLFQHYQPKSSHSWSKAHRTVHKDYHICEEPHGVISPQWRPFW